MDRLSQENYAKLIAMQLSARFTIYDYKKCSLPLALPCLDRRRRANTLVWGQKMNTMKKKKRRRPTSSAHRLLLRLRSLHIRRRITTAASRRNTQDSGIFIYQAAGGGELGSNRQNGEGKPDLKTSGLFYSICLQARRIRTCRVGIPCPERIELQMDSNRINKLKGWLFRAVHTISYRV